MGFCIESQKSDSISIIFMIFQSDWIPKKKEMELGFDLFDEIKT